MKNQRKFINKKNIEKFKDHSYNPYDPYKMDFSGSQQKYVQPQYAKPQNVISQYSAYQMDHPGDKCSEIEKSDTAIPHDKKEHPVITYPGHGWSEATRNQNISCNDHNKYRNLLQNIKTSYYYNNVLSKFNFISPKF